jgi:hypothetical protein
MTSGTAIVWGGWVTRSSGDLFDPSLPIRVSANNDAVNAPGVPTTAVECVIQDGDGNDLALADGPIPPTGNVYWAQ